MHTHKTDIINVHPKQQALRVAVMTYQVTYPADDTEGNALGKIIGAHVEMLGPGECEFRRVGFVDYPHDTVEIKVSKDGIYTLRHVVSGSCLESAPSPEIVHVVNVMPPAKPKPPKVETPCVPREHAVATVDVTWCHPGEDIQGDTLLNITGTRIELSPPGQSEWVLEKFVPFPQKHASLQLPEDGLYRVRIVTVGACTASDPSDPVAIPVDHAAPAMPPVGSVTGPCPLDR